jgi:hypothetical protein
VRRRGELVLLVVSFVLGGCSKARKPSPAHTDAASAAVASAPSASVRTSARPALEEPAVKRLVDAWLAAQNDGDFAAYERLYAPRFTGVKRAGTRETTYDRDGWLADRKSMFAQPMRVTAEKLTFSVTPAGASAELEQTWSSATFQDVGMKRLVIVPTPSGPRIAREEMLSSVVAGAGARLAAGDLLVVHRDGVILNTDAADAWASSPSRPGSANHVAVRDVDEAKLPAALSAWKGRSVRTFSADGSVCTAQVTGFGLRAEVIPHFGMEQHWRDELGEPPSGASEIAFQVWELAGTGGRVLVGKLSACQGSLWAVPEAKTLPIVASRVAPTPELRDRALRSFRALPSYQQIQKEFVASGKSATERWDASDEPSISVFESEGKLALVSVATSAGEGCGEFYGVLSAVFVPRPGSKTELNVVAEPISPEPLEPLAAFDLDGNGSFEVLFAPGPGSDERLLWRREAKEPRPTELFTVPYFDCPC